MKIPFIWQEEIPSWLVLLLQGVVLWFIYPRLPEMVPVHWNIDLEVDQYAGRFVGAVLPWLANIGLYVLMLVLSIFTKLGMPNIKILRRLRQMLVLFFAGVHIVILSAIVGVMQNHIFPRGIILLLGLFFIWVGNVMPKMQRNFWMGIRTPWTLQSELSWYKTHHLAGWIFVAMGFILTVSAITVAAPNILAMTLLFSLSGIPVLLWYSYYIWTLDKH